VIYAYTQDVPIGEDAYKRIIQNLGPEPLPGQLLHLCVRQPDGQLSYIDVWESEQACSRAFEDRIHPAVDAALAGQRPSGEPEVHRLDVLHSSGALVKTGWS